MPSSPPDGDHSDDLPPLPFGESLWLRIAEKLRLLPQQTRIVELILRKQQDKEIAARIDLQLPTVRTYLRRIFHSTQTTDRLDLVILILKIALEMPAEERGAQQ